MYKLIVAPRAKKELKKIKKIYESAISEAFQAIKEDPYTGKPLTEEFSGKFTYRVSIYRIIYTIDEKDKVVKILAAGHRGKVYK